MVALNKKECEKGRLDAQLSLLHMIYLHRLRLYFHEQRQHKEEVNIERIKVLWYTTLLLGFSANAHFSWL